MTATLRTTGAEDEGRAHMRGSSLLLFGRVTSLLFTVAAQVLVVRALTKPEYGAFAYALSIVSAGRVLLSLGQGKILSRFMAIFLEQRDYARMFGTMALAAVTIMLTSTVLLVGLALTAESVVATIGEPSAVQVLLVLMFLAPMEALDQVFVSLFAVFSKPRSIFFRKYLLTPSLRLVVVVALVLTGGSAVFLAVGYVVTQLIGIVIYVALLRRLLVERDLLRHLRVRSLRIPFRSVLSFSVPSLTGELLYLSMNTVSVVLLGVFYTAAEIAGYRAVFPTARLNQFAFASFVTLFLPMASRLFARGDHAGTRSTYWQTAAFLAVLTFPVYAMSGVFAPATTVTLFGERYAESALVLAILSSGFYVNVLLGFNTYTLQIHGRLRWLLVGNISAAVLNVGLSVALIPPFGAVGVAVANAATLITLNLANQLVLTRTIGTGFIARTQLRAYLMIALATVVLAAVQLIIEPGFVVAALVTTVVWLAVLLATRRTLQLRATFPEVAKIPVVRWLVR